MGLCKYQIYKNYGYAKKVWEREGGKYNSNIYFAEILLHIKSISLGVAFYYKVR